jgi:alkylation response protein AidB-like acyl-CoA dehydrogenase
MNVKDIYTDIDFSKLNNKTPNEVRKLYPNFCKIGLPKRFNEGHQDLTDIVNIYSKLGYINLNFRDVPGLGHGNLLTHASTRKFDPLLKSISEGKDFISIAITEPNTGSDLNAIETIATPKEKFYEISGTKMFVSRLEESTKIIVLANVLRDGLENGLTFFLVPNESLGISIESMEGLGLNGVSWGKLNLDKVVVPISNRIGGEGQGSQLFIKHFTIWRVLMSACAIGSARNAIDKSIERLKNRKAFGGLIGRFTHFQQELAQHTTDLHLCWLLILSTIEKIKNREPAFVDSCMCKAQCIEASIRTVEWSMNVFGAAGYSTMYDLQDRLKDLYGLRIADGTKEILRSQISRALLGEQLYELSLGRMSHDEIETLNNFQTIKYW